MVSLSHNALVPIVFAFTGSGAAAWMQCRQIDPEGYGLHLPIYDRNKHNEEQTISTVIGFSVRNNTTDWYNISMAVTASTNQFKSIVA